jgi:predicted GIY-YIG superfamily endonuclease
MAGSGSSSLAINGGHGPLESWYVYVLLCADDELYTGCTHDLSDRKQRHDTGAVPATASRGPVQLVWYCVFPDKYVAYRFEKYLKTGSGRAFLWKHILERKKPTS